MCAANQRAGNEGHVNNAPTHNSMPTQKARPHTFSEPLGPFSQPTRQVISCSS
jgi:hypothetical protein